MSKLININYLCALNSEAKPLIDHYRLKKSHSSRLPTYFAEHDFSEAQNTGLKNSEPDSSKDEISQRFRVNLVVSGIGANNIALACGWLAAKTDGARAIWLNVGIAGHANFELGELVRVVHCDCDSSGSSYYPSLVAKWSGQNASILSCAAPTSDYPEGQMVDMEASTFFASAKKFSSAELVQALKVVSDNDLNSIELLNASRISELIAANVAKINDYAIALFRLMPPSMPEVHIDPLIQHLHCTQSQLQQYGDLVTKLGNIGVKQDALDSLFKQTKSMSKVLEGLRDLQLQTAPALTARHVSL